jgi:hypothetical protein
MRSFDGWLRLVRRTVSLILSFGWQTDFNDPRAGMC